MTPFGLSGLLIGITSVSFGLFVLLMSANRKIGRIWFLFTLAVGAWGFGGMWISWTKTATEALLAWRLAFAFGVVWISPVFYHFVCTFLDLRRNRSIVLHYFITLVFLFTIPTSLFFSRVRWVFHSLYYVLGGALYPVYFAWWITLVLFSHYELIRAYHTASPGRKNQIKYFFFATAMGFSGGSIAYFPAFGIDIYPWGNFGIVLHPLIMSVAIVKHRLMDIELVARHTLTKLLAWGVIGLPVVIGMIMGHFLSSRTAFLYDRAPWDLLCVALNYSLSLTLLRNYKDPLCDRLRWVFTLLGTWQLLTVLLLTSPPYSWSQVVYRSGYAVGAFLLLALFSFWEEFFQNAKDRFSTIVRHGLEWTVLAMAVLSVLTPWIIRGLAFDPSHRLTAREMPGPLYSIFGIWFVVSLVCMGLWSIQAIRRLPQETSRSQKTWIIGIIDLRYGRGRELFSLCHEPDQLALLSANGGRHVFLPHGRLVSPDEKDCSADRFSSRGNYSGRSFRGGRDADLFLGGARPRCLSAGCFCRYHRERERGLHPGFCRSALQGQISLPRRNRTPR